MRVYLNNRDYAVILRALQAQQARAHEQIRDPKVPSSVKTWWRNEFVSVTACIVQIDAVQATYLNPITLVEEA